MMRRYSLELIPVPNLIWATLTFTFITGGIGLFFSSSYYEVYAQFLIDEDADTIDDSIAAYFVGAVTFEFAREFGTDRRRG